MLGFGTIAKKVFGSPNDRKVKAIQPLVAKINALEPEFEALSDEGLIQKTEEFRERAKGGEDLDALLPEAFANCREAARRALGLRAFDVQLMGGIFLHQGNIAEMKTGEGKTLVATFPAYLNALTGKGVHIVTVNEYLAKRDSEWMGKVFGALGLTTSVAFGGMGEDNKRAAYACDITYATNNELGFDYLRDNMRSELNQIFQKYHNFAIVDEVDSILIDEARTPLIISGPAQDRSELYKSIDTVIPELEEAHYTVDEKARSVTFTDDGNEFIEELLQRKNIENYALYLMDYGAPVGYRLFADAPEKVTGFIIQNGNAYEEGLPEFWDPIRAYWADPSEENAGPLRAFLGIEGTKWQFTHGTRNPDAISPDNYWHVQYLLDRPGNAEVQLELFYDYRTNLTLYPEWQALFREHQPPALVVWGKNDQIFPAEGAHPYRQDLTNVEFHLLDTGHFALEEDGAFIAEEIRDFLEREVTP